MNEWLTTGQMIDRLKVGEIAELDPKRIKGIENIAYDSVLRFSNSIVWYRRDAKKIGEIIEINDIMLSFKWRILPNYVSFIDAIKAYKGEGKTIANHTKSGIYYYYWEDGEPKCKAGNGIQIESMELPFTETFEGKWTIEEG